LRVGLALAEHGDKEAMPALLTLLDKLPRSQLFALEDLLFRLAGETSPGVPYGTTQDGRRRFREAWESWWEERGAKTDLPVRSVEKAVFLDRTLIVLLDENRVLDLDSEDKPRFEIKGLNFPLDAQYLPGDRVLLAEHNGGRITERHRSGTILWERDFPGPLVAQRLPNGNTFMAGRAQILEVDPDGHELWGLGVQPGEEFMRASKLAEGDIAVVVTDRLHRRQRFVRMDALGREGKSFPVNVNTFGGRIDVQADGKVLIPQLHQHQVVECDADGKVLREFRVPDPVAAVRLSNGHTVVTSMSVGRPRAMEFDVAGKQIWEFEVGTRVTRCLRR
jgi:hypothetical protein